MEPTSGCDRDLFGVPGMVALVTGGGSGLGLMIAKILVRNGAAKVYIVGRDEGKLSTAACSYSGTIIPIVGDVTSRENLESIAQRVREDSGHLNLVVANAGIAGPGLKGVGSRSSIKEFVDSVWSIPEGNFNDVYEVNCSAVFYTSVAFLELLAEGNARRKPNDPKSQVIAISSMVAFMRDPRYGFAYCSSKAATVALMKNLATFCVNWDIRFNTLAPGMFPTDLSAPALLPFRVRQDCKVDHEGAFARTFIPAERAGSEQDMTGAILYLTSRAGSYTNGSVLLVDGGKIAIGPATY